MKIGRSVGTLVVLLALGQAVAAAERPPRALDERTIAGAIEASPHDYIGALIEVVYRCEVRREETCFDRVRILELVAQAPPPDSQRVAGDDFFLLSATRDPSTPPIPAPRFVVFVVPISTSAAPTGYGAYLMDMSGENEAVTALREAVEGVLGQ